jgi:hypothetical protein
MPVSSIVSSSVSAEAWSPAVDDLIIRLVEERQGVKESELTLCVMVELAENRIASTPHGVLDSIQRLVRDGRIVGVDCEFANGGYTFLLPARTKVMIAMPIHIIEERTLH